MSSSSLVFMGNFFYTVIIGPVKPWLLKDRKLFKTIYSYRLSEEKKLSEVCYRILLNKYVE